MAIAAPCAMRSRAVLAVSTRSCAHTGLVGPRRATCSAPTRVVKRGCRDQEEDAASEDEGRRAKAKAGSAKAEDGQAPAKAAPAKAAKKPRRREGSAAKGEAARSPRPKEAWPKPEPRLRPKAAEPRRKAGEGASARRSRQGRGDDEVDEADAERKPKKVKPGSALVVVESPAKARTINKYLGANYIVKASVGHVRDLPKSKIGVDLENGTFEPVYEVIEGKKKVSPRSARRRARSRPSTSHPIPIAKARRSRGTSPRRSRTSTQNLRRVLINEITKKGVTAAIAAPRDDRHEQDGRAAGAPHPRSPRRLQDQPDPVEQGPARAVGGSRAVGRRAPRVRARGRDQGVHARGVLVGRRHVPRRRQPPPFEARIWRWKGEKAEPKTKDEADAIATELRAGDAVVASVDKKERRKKPQAPFITSQPAAGRRAQAAVLREAHDGARAAPLRRRRARRRGPDRPHHLHAYRLDAYLRRRADRGARAHHRDLRRGVPARGSRTRTATRSARRTPTRRSARR